MTGESSVLRSILTSFFIIAMISAASLQDSPKGTSGSMMECVKVSDTCRYGSCDGGTCSPCPFDPLRCCPLTPGNCTSAGGNNYGTCTSPCIWRV